MLPISGIVWTLYLASRIVPLCVMLKSLRTTSVWFPGRKHRLPIDDQGTCGRTQAGGNIDTSTAIEQHIDAKIVTEVTKGSILTIQMHQVNGDGAGPYL